MASILEKLTKKKFDPDGDDYDYETAEAKGIKPGPDGHWQSRYEFTDDEAYALGLPPGSGLILKGIRHETFHKTIAGEDEAGYELIKMMGGPLKGRTVSIPKR
jgi:hypothetical protein